MNTWKKWLIIIGILNFGALMSFSAFMSGFLMDRETIPAIYILVNEFTAFNTVLLLLPVMIWYFNRMPVTRTTWYYRVPLYIIFTMIIGIIHTLLMTISRSWLYYWLGLGPYNLGEPFYRFALEYHKQFLSYTLVYGLVRFQQYHRANRKRERDAARMSIQAERLKNQLAEIRLETLKSQIHPHFLFNTLNMISSIMYDDVKKADRMISTLSDLLRLTLERSGESTVPFKDELMITEKYLDIMKARFEDNLSVEWSVAPGLDDNKVPSMILQPLVENSIKHNPLERSGSAFVRIMAKRENGVLALSVEDNGPGLDPGENIFDRGIGLRNTKLRMEQLYGDKGGLVFEARAEGGLRVLLRIPVEPS